MSRRGSQFNWRGAEIPSAVGGKRAHPPKTIAKINTRKVNKKELKIAFESALSASADGKKVSKRYKRLEGKKIGGIPFVVESKLSNLKTKNLISSVKKILGKDLFELAIPKKTIRKGKGKLRGRKYKSTAGLLIVVGDKESNSKTFKPRFRVDSIGQENHAYDLDELYDLIKEITFGFPQQRIPFPVHLSKRPKFKY